MREHGEHLRKTMYTYEKTGVYMREHGEYVRKYGEYMR